MKDQELYFRYDTLYEYAKSPTAKSCNQARPVQQFYVYLNNS